MSDGYWIGVDLGGTKILTGLFDDEFQLLARNKQATGAGEGAAGVFGRVAQSVETAIAEAKIDRAKILGMGFAIPGQIEPGKPVVRFAPNLDWRNVEVPKHLPESWTWPIVLENDVRMGTYGEFARGAARGAKHVFGIFVGTGVGGGFILNGELFTGFNGHAGEIGHIVLHWIKGTTLESVAGRKYLMQRAKAALENAPKPVRKAWKGVDTEKMKSSQLADFYDNDESLAVTLIDDAARALGAAIGSVINLMSPEVIVIGGGLAGALGETFLERIWDIAQKYTLPGAAEGVKFVAAGLEDDAGIIGAAAYAKAKLGGTL